MSLVSTTTCGTVANMRCVWASINPGISVRPPPGTCATVTHGGASIAVRDTALMMLPTTRTFEGSVSLSDLPSKILTFSNTKPLDYSACARTGGAAPAAVASNTAANLRKPRM